MSKKKSAVASNFAQSPTSIGYGSVYDPIKAKALIDATSDEEIGRMYRQRKEAQEFLQARGLY